MGVIHKRASLILVITDGYTNSKSLKGVINIRTENGIYARDKGEGCYVFVDCYPGKYKIIVEPSVYEKQSFEVNIDEGIQVRYLMLQPGRNYPLLKQATRVSGAGNGEIFAALEGNEAGSVLEKVPVGDKKIKLYFSGITEVLGKNFYFSNEDKYCVRRILDEGEGESEYLLDEALDFDIMPYTQILPIYESYVEDGRYYLVIKSSYQRVHLLGDVGKKTLELQPNIMEYSFDYKEV